MAILKDIFGRNMDYLRLSVLDRCNLRCFYCMPEEGIKFLPRKDLLTYEEMLRLVNIFTSLGVKKLRLTGGEPFLRKDFLKFLHMLADVEALDKISITTNGVLTGKYLTELKELGIENINLSLDTLNPKNFIKITRRDEFSKVYKTLEQLIEKNFKVKLNMVVMDGLNYHEINDFVKLSLKYPINVRFIEEMPFNGTGKRIEKVKWNHVAILNEIKSEYSTIIKIDDGPNSTSSNYRIKGSIGSFGIIAAYSRTFCGTCNRVRVTASGDFKTCLYDNGGINLRDLLRQSNDKAVKEAIINQVLKKARNGFEAEKSRPEVRESMATIGG